MAPVAALIVVRPCIEVNAIEGDALDADAERKDARAHFAVEAVFVHAEVGGRVTESDEAWCRRGMRFRRVVQNGNGRAVTHGSCFHAVRAPSVGVSREILAKAWHRWPLQV
jgi:hypothetical protein